MLLRRLLALTATGTLCVSGRYTLPPALQAAKDSGTSTSTQVVSHNLTDAATIVKTANIVDQKAGAPTDGTPPGLPQAATMLTALDGKLMVGKISPSNSSSEASGGLARRTLSDYELIFNGTWKNDAAIEGTAYLTYTVVSNASYSQGRDECLQFCDRTTGCVFVNLYYEFNNPLLDFVFSEKSNLKCAVYGDVHTAAEKTNQGGQQLAASPSAPTYVERSSGFASLALLSPPVPAGYELVFGPISAANNAPGYMGFAFLDKYDPTACAKLCNGRNPDPVGGACKYFNIWRAVVSGIPTTYTCSMYYIPTNASTAVNTGQGPLVVTLSRGYARISHLQDPGFEAFECPDQEIFCFADRSPDWVGTSPYGGLADASIFHYALYAHQGAGVALLGSADGTDALPGTLAPAAPLAGLVGGCMYVVQFFHSSAYSDAELEESSFVEVWWGGALAGSVHVGFQNWTYFEFRVVALGGGADTLQLKGGAAPAYDFLDDIYLFLA